MPPAFTYRRPVTCGQQPRRRTSIWAPRSHRCGCSLTWRRPGCCSATTGRSPRSRRHWTGLRTSCVSGSMRPGARTELDSTSTTQSPWWPNAPPPVTRCSRPTPTLSWPPGSNQSPAQRRTWPGSGAGWRSRPRLASRIEALFHVDALIAADEAPCSLAVPETGVDRDVLHHDLVRIEREQAEPEHSRLPLGELHQLPPKPATLRGRSHSDVLDQQAVARGDEHDN